MSNQPKYPQQVGTELYGAYPQTHGYSAGWLFNPGEPHALSGQLHGLRTFPNHSCAGCLSVPKYWKLHAPELSQPADSTHTLEQTNRWAGDFLLQKQPWWLGHHQIGIAGYWCHYISPKVPKDHFADEQDYWIQARWSLASEYGHWFLVAWGAPDVTANGGVGDIEYNNFTGGQPIHAHPDNFLGHGIAIFRLVGPRFKCRQKNTFYFWGTEPADPHPYSNGGGSVDTQMHVTVEPYWP